MKLTDQVTSLELSKRLKELGVKQGSFFVWVQNTNSVNDETVRARNWHGYSRHLARRGPHTWGERCMRYDLKLVWELSDGTTESMLYKDNDLELADHVVSVTKACLMKSFKVVIMSRDEQGSS